MSLAISRIQVPTDFSRCAEHALEVGLFLARRYGAHLELLNVTELAPDCSSYPCFSNPDPRVGSFQAYQAAKQSLDKALSRVRTAGVTVHPATMRGRNAAETICSFANGHRADLVVIGTHGRHGRRPVLGSVAESVVRHAPCPVLTVREDQVAAPDELQNRVLVPVDFSHCSLQAVRKATHLVRSSGGQLLLFHAVSRDRIPLLYQSNPVDQLENQAQALQRAQKRLQQVADELINGAVPVRLRVVSGGAARCITDYVKSHPVSMICLSTHGRTGLPRFFWGSVAEKVVRTAECPVLTVRSFGRSLASRAANHAA